MAKAYLVPTFHHDIAYLRPEKEYTARCLEIIDEAIRIMEENPEYHYFVEQTWLWEEYWQARPDKRDTMRKLAKEGRLTLEPGMYAVPDMTLPDGESMYMQVTMGKKIAKDTLGYDPRVCMITDCWGHHAQLPQIMTQCGYDYYAFSRCMRPDVAVQNFVWKGVDGSKIRSHWLSTHYDGVGFPTEGEIENAGELEWADAGEKGIGMLMEKNRADCGDDPQYLPVGGDMRYPSSAAPKIVRDLNTRGKLPELKFAAPGEALDAINWEGKQEAEGDFMSSMQGTFATNIWIKQADRYFANEIYALETLSAALGAKKDFTLAWKLHLKNQFHDTICGTICNRAYRDVEADFRALGHLLTQIRRELTSEAGRMAYFNALPYERHVRTQQGLLTLPAMGFAYADEAVKPSKVEATLPLTFENEWYTAQVGEDGYITSLIEKTTGRELVSATDAKGKRAAFGSLSFQMDYGDSWWSLGNPTLDRRGYAMVYNRPDPLFNENHGPYMSHILDAKIESADEDAIVIKQTGAISFWVTKLNYTTTITLSKSVREIKYHTEFTNESKNIRVRVAFPVKNLPETRRQIPYAIMPYGEHEGEQTVQMFMDAQDEKAGLAVINVGTPSGTMEDGVMLINMFRAAAMEYKCDSDLSYNLGREFAFDYAVCPHVSGADDVIWQTAQGVNVPVIDCRMPVQDKGVKVEGAYVSAVRETENGVFVRVYNPSKEQRECRVTLPAGCTEIVLADGLGQPMADAQPVGTQITLGAYKVQGILIR